MSAIYLSIAALTNYGGPFQSFQPFNRFATFKSFKAVGRSSERRTGKQRCVDVWAWQVPCVPVAGRRGGKLSEDWGVDNEY